MDNKQTKNEHERSSRTLKSDRKIELELNLEKLNFEKKNYFLKNSSSNDLSFRTPKRKPKRNKKILKHKSESKKSLSEKEKSFELKDPPKNNQTSHISYRHKEDFDILEEFRNVFEEGSYFGQFQDDPTFAKSDNFEVLKFMEPLSETQGVVFIWQHGIFRYKIDQKGVVTSKKIFRGKRI